MEDYDDFDDDDDDYDVDFDSAAHHEKHTSNPISTFPCMDHLSLVVAFVYFLSLSLLVDYFYFEDSCWKELGFVVHDFTYPPKIKCVLTLRFARLVTV